MTFNPWRLLRYREHLTQDFIPMPGRSGLWLADLQTILLAPGQTQVGRRSALAHELAHVELGHDGCVDRRSAVRQEIAAESLAARWLISLDALVDAELWGRSPSEVAEELWVDVALLRRRVLDLDDDERAYMNGRLASRNEDIA